MSKTCKNPECKKEVKGKKEFCSIPCFSVYRKLFPEKYQKGIFKEGHSPWSKGKKFTKIGKTFIRRKGKKNKRDLKYVNIGDGNGGIKYIRNDKYVWELHNGPVPKGYAIYHKDGRSLNDEIENLECITKGDALSRYSLLQSKTFDLTKKGHIQKIINGCERGDRKIQQQLYKMMYGKMMSVAMRYSSKSKDNAKDILSDAFVKVFTKIKTVDVNRGNLEGWVRSIVMYTGIDYVRKNNKIDFITDSIDDSFGDDEDSDFIFNKIFEEEKFSETMDGEYIIQMIQELPPSYGLVFNLIAIEGYTHKQVSEELGITEGTSKSNYFKARENLKKKIVKFNEEDETFLEEYNYEMEDVY